MKKLILLFVLMGFMAHAQELQKQNEFSPNLGEAAKMTIQDYQNFVLDYTPNTSAVVIPKDAPAYKLNTRSMNYGRTLIGRSQYGLQTNASVGRRSVLYPDGKISAVFTVSPDISPWNTRGSGYNHFDGSTWTQGVVENRIEIFRSGWPNLTPYNDGANTVEVNVSHYAEANGGSGGYSLNINEGIGSTTWTETSKDKNSGPIWARTAQSGDYLYIVGSYSDTMVYKNGVRMPTVYSRYNLKTKTWLQDKITLPGYDDKLYTYGSADAYSIDAKDNIVAIVNARRLLPVVLWKSEDYGATFEMIYVDNFKMPVPQFLGDTTRFYYNDGSCNVVIDNDGTCHIFYGVTIGFTFDPAVTDGSFMYYPSSNGMFYFNDKWEQDSVITYDTSYKDTTVYRLWVDNKVENSIHYMKSPSWWSKFNTADSTTSKFYKPSMTLKLYNDVNKPYQATTLVVWPTYFNITKWDTITGMALDSTLVPPDSFIMLDSFVVEKIDKITSKWEKFKTYPNKGKIPTAIVLDRNGDGTTNIEVPTYDPMATAGARYGNTALVTMPMASLDNDGNIFLIYSAPVEEAISPLNGENYRDVYIVYSNNGGVNWSPAQNISDNPLMEDVFANMPKRINDYIHVFYQEDEEPGTEEQNKDAPSVNYQFYIKILKQDILDDIIGPGAGVGIKEIAKNEVSVKGVYPNPASLEADVVIDLQSAGNVNAQIFDILGQKVQNINFNNLKAGRNNLHLDISNLKSGAYFLTVNTDSFTSTVKLIVE